MYQSPLVSAQLEILFMSSKLRRGVSRVVPASRACFGLTVLMVNLPAPVIWREIIPMIRKRAEWS